MWAHSWACFHPAALGYGAEEMDHAGIWINTHLTGDNVPH
jgi:hypothetical protein